MKTQRIYTIWRFQSNHESSEKLVAVPYVDEGKLDARYTRALWQGMATDPLDAMSEYRKALLARK
jgi:hypothetical protein